MYKSCKSAKERFLIGALFDSGMRVKKGSDNFIKLILKEGYSKTKGRTIGLYCRYSYEAVRDYLNERISEGIKDDEPLLAINTIQIIGELKNYIFRLLNLNTTENY